MTKGEEDRLKALAPFRVSGVDYALRVYSESVPKEVDAAPVDSIDGFCHRPLQRIGLARWLSYRQAVATLLHELMHALWRDRVDLSFLEYAPSVDGKPTKWGDWFACVEESVVTTMAAGLAALLADNPRLAKEIGRLYGRKRQ